MAIREVLAAAQPRVPNLLALLLTVWLSWYLTTSISSYRRLRHIPGPYLASFSNWWWIRAAVSGKGHLALADACTRYGMHVPDHGDDDLTGQVHSPGLAPTRS